MLQHVMAHKKSTRQVWTTAGKRLPVTQLSMAGNLVVHTQAVEGETEANVRVAFGDKKLKNMNKLNILIGKRRFVDTKGSADLQLGQELKVEELFQPGDMIKVTGTSKGTGFTGVVKRWHFSGGPRTHGQSDRVRAPGSIGAGTTPGHVWKGKHMAGRSGNAQVTLETVVVVAVNPADQSIWVKGTMPGAKTGILDLRKNGVAKNAPELSAESLLQLGVGPAVEPAVEVSEATQEASV